MFWMRKMNEAKQDRSINGNVRNDEIELIFKQNKQRQLIELKKSTKLLQHYNLQNNTMEQQHDEIKSTRYYQLINMASEWALYIPSKSNFYPE